MKKNGSKTNFPNTVRWISQTMPKKTPSNVIYGNFSLFFPNNGHSRGIDKSIPHSWIRGTTGVSLDRTICPKSPQSEGAVLEKIWGVKKFPVVIFWCGFSLKRGKLTVSILSKSKLKRKWSGLKSWVVSRSRGFPYLVWGEFPEFFPESPPQSRILYNKKTYDPSTMWGPILLLLHPTKQRLDLHHFLKQKSKIHKLQFVCVPKAGVFSVKKNGRVPKLNFVVNSNKKTRRLEIFWVVPLPSNSQHQDHYISSRGSL